MDATSTFTIKFKDKEEDTSEQYDYLSECFSDLEEYGDNGFKVEESYECVYAEDFEEIATELANINEDLPFTIKGLTDCNGNEFQNFKLEYKKGKIVISTSDWHDEDEKKPPLKLLIR